MPSQSSSKNHKGFNEGKNDVASATVPLARKEVSILSPLRYPGAKRRLSGYISEVLRLNSLRPKLFVEPFAGGASAALQLLKNNSVERIALGEKDPLIASFWKVVFNDSEWLIHEIENIEVTVDKWRYFRNASFHSHRERALACLFLNRTSFSGILARAGPIGGYSQVSAYRIDCRFKVETITRRIRQASALRERVLFVENCDWQETIVKVKQLGYGQNEVFYYLDPPFYKKAKELYRYYFEEIDHLYLHNTLVAVQEPWLLSYDPAEPIVNMYSHNGCGPKHIDLLYSISGKDTQVKTQELIITNLAILPSETRLWRSSEEWRKAPSCRNSSSGSSERKQATKSSKQR